MGKWILWWVIPVLIVFSIGTVWLRLSIIRTTYAIDQADRELLRIRHDREQIQLKMAALRSPKRLEGLAHSQFGLFQPSADQVVYLKKVEDSGDGI